MVKVKGTITKVSGKNITFVTSRGTATLPVCERWIIDVAVVFMDKGTYVEITINEGEIFDINKYDPYQEKAIADKAVG